MYIFLILINIFLKIQKAKTTKYNLDFIVFTSNLLDFFVVKLNKKYLFILLIKKI